MSGTDVVYAAMPRSSIQSGLTDTGESTGESTPGRTCLRAQYAIPGTTDRYRATRLLCDTRYYRPLSGYALAMRCLVPTAIGLRACYTMPGTDRYRATRLLCDARV
eukprot:2408469-Rhodomonas_salina.2